MSPSVLVDESDPFFGKALEILEFVRVNGVVHDTGNHGLTVTPLIVRLHAPLPQACILSFTAKALERRISERGCVSIRSRCLAGSE